MEQNRDLREAHEKSLNEMEEFKRFQGSTFDFGSRGRFLFAVQVLSCATTVVQECDAAQAQLARAWNRMGTDRTQLENTSEEA